MADDVTPAHPGDSAVQRAAEAEVIALVATELLSRLSPASASCRTELA